jgi:membrane protease YdiL (CAAX protease family)
MARRHRTGWLAAQLLLGVGLARPAPLVVTAAVVSLLLLAVLVPVARLTIVTLAAVVALVTAVPQSWPLPALLAGAALLAAERARTVGRGGTPTRHGLFWGLGVGLLAAGVVAPLVLGAVESAPLAFPVQQPPAVALAALVLGAAVLNAASEELLWRGAIVAVDNSCGLGAGATVAAQAVGFGIAHLHGLPGGPIGVLAAGVFGAAMAWLRLRAGLPIALVAHVLADVAIFSIVAATAVFIPG